MASSPRSSVIALLLGAALSVAGAQTTVVSPPAPSPAAPIRIGLIFPLTGGSSDMGNSARIGAQLAVNEVNDVGGYLGHPLELVIRDDEAKPDLGRHHAEDLVLKEKVIATVGFCNTGVAAKSLDVFQTHQHVLIVPCATGSVLTAKYAPAESYIFRDAPRDALQTEFLAAELVRRGLRKPAFIVDDSGYGDAGLKDLGAAFAKQSIQAVATIRFAVGVKDLSAEVREARAAGADALIGWTVGPESGVLARSRAAANWKVPQFGPWTLSHRSALEASQGSVEGTMMVQTVLPNLYLERNSSFLARYAKLSKERPIGSMMAAAQSYDAVQLLLRAMFATRGDFSGPALKKSLENLPQRYAGVVTTYDAPFSANDHDSVSANMLWLGTWRNGERAYHYPEDARKASIIRHKEQ